LDDSVRARVRVVVGRVGEDEEEEEKGEEEQQEKEELETRAAAGEPTLATCSAMVAAFSCWASCLFAVVVEAWLHAHHALKQPAKVTSKMSPP